MKIPVLIEPGYRQSIWCLQTLGGLYAEAGRKRYELMLMDGADCEKWDADAFFGTDKRLAILVGTSGAWMPDALRALSARNIGALLVSFQPEEESLAAGTVLMDYSGAIGQLEAFLRAAGCRRIALYGVNPNSSADSIKRRAFGDESAVFENDGSLDLCWRRFMERMDEFDGVICANDIVAVSLLERLKAAGIDVPGRLQTVSFGDSVLARVMKPGITTASLDHGALGREAVSLYAYLTRHDGVAVNVRVRCRIAIRGSTGPVCQTETQAAYTGGSRAVDFYGDGDVKRIMAAEDFLAGCDEADWLILAGLIDGESGERVAEREALSDRTVRYRLRRLIDKSGFPDRKALTEWLTERIDREALVRCMEDLKKAKL